MSTPMEVCANCRWWAWESGKPPAEHDTADCRRFPPTAHVPEKVGRCPKGNRRCWKCYECGIAFSEFPVVFAWEWCGELKMRDDPWEEWSE